MKREVKAGVGFLKRMAVACGKLDEPKAELFAEKLEKHLCDKYANHWYPDSPSKGQAYRCIRINNGTLCDIVLKACEESELTPRELGLPPEFTLWIDPLEVCARCAETSRPFTIERFEGDGEEDAKEEEGGDSTHLDTSDYHSATSSDCGSAASSDAEEEAKDDEKEVLKEGMADGGACTITMVPRFQKRHVGKNKVKYVRNMIPASLQYVYPPTPAWPQYKKGAPVFLNTICAAPTAPPPPQQVFGYYILPQPSPQFILPQASLQRWGSVKG